MWREHGSSFLEENRSSSHFRAHPGQIEGLPFLSYIVEAGHSYLKFGFSSDWIEAVKLLELGITYDAAELLNLSRRTVNTHRNNILKKMNWRNNAGMTFYAIKKNLVHEHPPSIRNFIHFITLI
ncbi:MAG: response regulator transcription factor [Nitrospinae bacterium]|nr:response regulator transcription factor [Nitrospinota bacterium]